MHSALFVVSVPSDPSDWTALLNAVHQKIADTKGVVRLSENVWMLDLTKSLSGLSHLVFSADQKKLKYGILPFADAPQWLPGDFGPTPIPVRSDTNT